MNETDLVKEWYRFALTDLQAARHLFESMNPKPLEIICYHCQQAAEKALKGFLISHGVRPPYIHDLEELCLECMKHNPSFGEIQQVCQELTNYGVPMRYPGDVEIKETEAISALEKAKKICTFCSDLNPSLPRG